MPQKHAMNVTNLKNIANESELAETGSVQARICETHVYPSRFSQHPKREIYSHGEEAADISKGLTIVIWDKGESKTIVLSSGDVAILPHNT
ncbi:MAG: hypothetical protein QM706_02420 [Nitrospira sp.]